MAWCDLAVTAGGSTLWELAYFHVPSVVLIVAENQRLVQWLHAQGLPARWRRQSTFRGGVASAVRELASDTARRTMLADRFA